MEGIYHQLLVDCIRILLLNKIIHTELYVGITLLLSPRPEILPWVEGHPGMAGVCGFGLRISLKESTTSLIVCKGFFSSAFRGTTTLLKCKA